MEIDIKIICPEESEIAFSLTRELMEYHNALDVFTMTPQRFRILLENHSLKSCIAYADGDAVGVMNFFYKYTTFSGRKILYIEDLYAKEKYRGHGIGGKLLDKAKEIAAENDCEQIELKCASWNKNSAGFYESHGMKQEKEWNVYTLERSFF